MVDLALDLRFLRAAIVAAEQRSFRKAALVLGTSESSVSRRVRLLERRLGFGLFERNSQGVRLTPAGAEFLREATEGIEKFDRAVQLAAATHRGERGELHIGVLASLPSGFVHRLLRRFRAASPNVRVGVHEGTAKENFHRLELGQLDIAFLIRMNGYDGYETSAFLSERMVIAMPEGHRLASKEQLAWSDVESETFVLSRGGSGPDFEHFLRERLAPSGTCPNVEVHEVGPPGLMSLVSMGYRLALTCTSVAEISVPGVIVRPLAGDENMVTQGAVWAGNNKNPALRQLISLARAVARDSKGSGKAPRMQQILGTLWSVLVGLGISFDEKAQMLGLWR
jgi:DNA-binding transcriptional LysR family regulator